MKFRPLLQLDEPQTGNGQEAFLLAHPAAHSLSPLMHNAAFSALGWSARYQARDVTPAELAGALADLRRPQVLGANLSLPHKEAALPLLDTLSEAARSIGAVNTIVQRGGQLHGDNTDAPGLLLALQAAGDTGTGAAVVLGAGGAARAAVWALCSQGRAVYVINRTPARAAQLVSDLGGVVSDAEGAPWGEVTLLVNASSAGLSDPLATPLPGFDFGRLDDTLVYDMVYKPAQTRLMEEARRAGLRAENGLGMLAQQARLAFAAWTGQDMGADIFMRALRP